MLWNWTCDWEIKGSPFSRCDVECDPGQFSKSFTDILPPSPGSILWYQHKVGGKQAHHATQWPRVHGTASLASVWQKTGQESEISAVSWATKLSKDTSYAIFQSTQLFHSDWMINWLGFNRTFSTVRLYHALKIYSLVRRLISVKWSKILRFGECNNMCESWELGLYCFRLFHIWCIFQSEYIKLRQWGIITQTQSKWHVMLKTWQRI